MNTVIIRRNKKQAHLEEFWIGKIKMEVLLLELETLHQITKRIKEQHSVSHY
jgi:hypothetical protein